MNEGEIGSVVSLVGLMTALLVSSAFFSCSETAFFSLSRVELSRIRKATRFATRRLISLLRHPRDTLVGILLGNEVVNCAIAIVGAQLINLFVSDGVIASILAILFVTPLVVTFGEVVPKNLAIGFAGQISPALAVPVHIFLWLTTPIRWVLMHIADNGIRLFGGDPGQVRALIFEEEFRQLVDIGESHGELSDSEREWIHGLFTFGDTRVCDIMTAAEKIFHVPLSWDYQKVLAEVRQAQYARVPVYENDPNVIIGLLYVRDLLSLQSRDERGLATELEEIVRPVLFVDPKTKVEEILREFQRTKMHMAIVRDNKEQEVLGIVTMDDVLNAFIGKPNENGD